MVLAKACGRRRGAEAGAGDGRSPNVPVFAKGARRNEGPLPVAIPRRSVPGPAPPAQIMRRPPPPQQQIDGESAGENQQGEQRIAGNEARRHGGRTPFLALHRPIG